MGKGNDLWDDSALINAFDHAINTYKEVHLKNNHESHIVIVEKTAGHVESEDNDNNISGHTAETCTPYDSTEVTPEDIPTQGNNIGADVHAPEADPSPSGFPCSGQTTNSCYDQQSTDYAELLRQYYELEDQKQKVVQRLHQANYWNYETRNESSTYQFPQVSGYNVPEQCLQTPCSLCSCHCIAVPLISSAEGYSCPLQLVCCSGSQSHQIPGSQFSAKDGLHSASASVNPGNHIKADANTVKAGMLAIERVIDSMKAEQSATSNSCEQKKGQDISSGTSQANVSQSISSDTDLTTVLKAWYMAGFHTGRYLLEQSTKNGHH